MGGAGILFCSVYNKKLYFLFGKENKYNDTPGWCDFGGGTDNNETFLQTALREATEEITGFLGSKEELLQKMKKGTYNLQFDNYKMFILPIEYDEKLPFYFNNNQKFLQKKLDPKLIEKSKIFEKSEIKWVCIDDFAKMKPHFRSYFQKNSDIIFHERKQIYDFVCKKQKHKRTRRTHHSKKNKTVKRKRL